MSKYLQTNKWYLPQMQQTSLYKNNIIWLNILGWLRITEYGLCLSHICKYSKIFPKAQNEFKYAIQRLR